MAPIKLLSLFGICILTACSDNTDKIEKYIANNTHKINSISPDDNDFHDLVKLGNVIGNKRVVLLGEQDHGDANTFLAKTRLIRYLHSKKGFTRILFEEDFSSLLLHDLNNLHNPTDRITNTLDDYWLKCKSFLPMIEYFNHTFKSSNPIIYSGMDIYIDGKVPTKLLELELNKVIDSNPAIELETLFKDIVKFYEYSSKRKLGTLGRAHIEKLYSELNQSINKIRLNRFQEQIIKNIQAYMGSLLADYGATIRDLQMAKNVLWYMDNYPEEKFIIWTANTHAAKNAWEMITGEYGRRRSMGEHLAKSIPNDLYSIGTVSYDGNFGRINQSLKKIKAPPSASLDHWLKKNNFNYAFIDFSLFNSEIKNYPSMYNAKGLSHNLEKGQWHNIFDGILYVEQMKSCLN